MLWPVWASWRHSQNPPPAGFWVTVARREAAARPAGRRDVLIRRGGRQTDRSQTSPLPPGRCVPHLALLLLSPADQQRPASWTWWPELLRGTSFPETLPGSPPPSLSWPHRPSPLVSRRLRPAHAAAAPGISEGDSSPSGAPTPLSGPPCPRSSCCCARCNSEGRGLGPHSFPAEPCVTRRRRLLRLPLLPRAVQDDASLPSTGEPGQDAGPPRPLTADLRPPQSPRHFRVPAASWFPPLSHQGPVSPGATRSAYLFLLFNWSSFISAFKNAFPSTSFYTFSVNRRYL